MAGLTGSEALFRNVRTGVELLATIVPDSGEIDEAGWHPVTIRFGNRELAGWALLR